MKFQRVRTGMVALAFCAVIAAPAAMAGTAAKGAIPVTTSSEEAKALFQKGQHELDRGRGLEANALFRKAVGLDPDFAYAWFNIGNSAFSGEEFAKATRRALEAADKANVSEGEHLLIEVNMTFVNNDAEKRIALSKTLTGKYPNSMRAWMMRAGAEASLNRHDEARALMENAATLAPDHIVPPTGLGFSYLFNNPKDLRKAESYFRKTVAMEPKEDSHHVNLGDSLRAQNRLNEARAAYTKATGLRPANGVAQVKKGHVNSFLGNYAEARTDYDRGVEAAEPGYKVLYANYRAFTHVHAGNPSAAIEELGTLLDVLDGQDLPEEQKQGPRAITLNNQLVIALHHGLFDVAETALAGWAKTLRAQAAKVQNEAFGRGQEANIAYFEGQLAARRGDYDRAVALAKKNAKLLEPDSNPRKLENHHDLMGLVHLLKGEHDKAVKHYRQANLTVMYQKYHLALALDGAGEKDEAKALFKEIAAWNFNSVGYALVRKDCLSRISS